MEKSEILEKYGNVPLDFTYYYKYSFMFFGIAPDGTRINANISGSDEIYKLEITPTTKITLSGDQHTYASVKINGNEVWEECSE